MELSSLHQTNKKLTQKWSFKQTERFVLLLSQSFTSPQSCSPISYFKLIIVCAVHFFPIAAFLSPMSASKEIKYKHGHSCDAQEQQLPANEDQELLFSFPNSTHIERSISVIAGGDLPKG